VELSFSYTPAEGAPSALVDLLVRADNTLSTRLLLPSVAAGSGVPAKSLLVWTVLIAAWAASSLGWMSMMVT